jgi:hypothetical protein
MHFEGWHPILSIVAFNNLLDAPNQLTRNAGLFGFAKVLISRQYVAAQDQDVAVPNER